MAPLTTYLKTNLEGFTTSLTFKPEWAGVPSKVVLTSETGKRARTSKKEKTRVKAVDNSL